jgi:hypothetical protein
MCIHVHQYYIHVTHYTLLHAWPGPYLAWLWSRSGQGQSGQGWGCSGSSTGRTLSSLCLRALPSWSFSVTNCRGRVEYDGSTLRSEL